MGKLDVDMKAANGRLLSDSAPDFMEKLGGSRDIITENM